VEVPSGPYLDGALIGTVSELLVHALWSGLALSLYLGSAFIALSFLNPEMWLGDYPPDIREAWGPMSPAARRQKWLLGVPVLAIALGMIVLATAQIRGVPPPSFGEVWLHTFVMLSVFNLVDLLVIDWLLFVRVRPAFVVLPGTEGMAGYDDYGFHARAFLVGTAGIAIFSMIVAGVAVLAWR